jgi:molybdopterin/thiamine biosynthesis adenylyltransferase/ubiquitin-protein ligase
MWWSEEHPARLVWELEQFTVRKLKAQEFKDVTGSIIIETELPFRGRTIPVTVSFPYDYPDFAPLVYGPVGLLDRHQNIRAGNFCLLDVPGRDWLPHHSAAQLVDEDLRWLLEDTERGPGAIAKGEAPIAEPYTAWFSYVANRIFLVPEPFWDLELDRTGGKLTIAEAKDGGLLLLADAEGIGIAPDTIARYLAPRNPKVGRWLAIERPPTLPVASADAFIAEIRTADPEAANRLNRVTGSRRLVTEWLALTFLEEGPTRGRRRRAWVLVHVASHGPSGGPSISFIEANAFTNAERQRRIPEMWGLNEVSLLVVGAGSLGAPIALELAKAGVQNLYVIDDDTYDVNNAVRHILPVRFAGKNKAESTAVMCRDLNPFVSVTGHNLKVGGFSAEAASVHELIKNTDMTIDTTGDLQVSRVLQRRCSQYGRVLVVASLTAGAYGGDVAVLRPGRACFTCFILHQSGGTLPLPGQGPESEVTPVGCSHPAFTGSGFEATELASVTARTAIALTGKTTYPGLDYDWVVLNFRTQPHWQQGTLEVHPDCPNHR